MARKPAKLPPLPSEEDILAFIQAAPGMAGKREISRHFGIRGADKIGLKALLRRMEEDGLLARRRRKVIDRAALPPVTVLEVTGTDKDGKPLNVKAEFNDVSHKKGVLSMARASDPDSASSQFFIVVKDSPFLDRQYTVFGEVVKGLDVVDRIVTESNSDTSDPRSGGKPRAYQKILKVELVEQTPDKA